eukprot:gene39118-47595_t
MSSSSGRKPGKPQAVPNNDLLSMFSDFAFNAANTAGKITSKGLGIVNSTVDAVGLKDKVEAAENMARKLATRGKNDANRAVNRARRMATRAFDFEEEIDSLASYDYDLLLSLAGAVEKSIAGYGSVAVNFTIPIGSSMIWKARVKKFDVGFSVREIRESEANNSIPFIIEPLQRFTPDQPIQGEITAVTSRVRTIQLVFDNGHTALQRKTVVYWVSIGENVSLKDDQSSAARNKEMQAAETGPPDYSTFTHY